MKCQFTKLNDKSFIVREKMIPARDHYIANYLCYTDVTIIRQFIKNTFGENVNVIATWRNDEYSYNYADYVVLEFKDREDLATFEFMSHNHIFDIN